MRSDDGTNNESSMNEASPVICLTLSGRLVELKPARFLGDSWSTYLACVEGSIYDRKTRRTLATIDKVPGMIRRLRDAGFAVDTTEGVDKLLAEHDVQLWNDVQAAMERAAAFDTEMRKKTNPATGKAYYLYDFQRTGIVWLSMKWGALLADQMGLGKSIQVIAAIPANAPVIIVCPKSVKGVWRSEIAKWRPSLRASVLSGRQSFRWPEPGQAIIINYDVLPPGHTPECEARRKDKRSVIKDKHIKTCNNSRCEGCYPSVPGRHTEDCLERRADFYDKLARSCPGCLSPAEVAKECEGCSEHLGKCPENLVLVPDEAHLLNNSKTRRSRNFRALAKVARERAGRVWELTATPVMNNPPELWNVLSAAQIAKDVFGTYKTFLKLFDGQAVNEWGGMKFGEPETDEVVERVQRVMLRRTRADVMRELPQKTIQHVPVEIDRDVLMACDEAVKAYGGFEKLWEDLATLGSGGLSFQTMSKIASALAKAKIPAMLEMVEQYELDGEPAVVCSAHRAPIDLLAKRPGWLVITGDTTTDERDRIVEAFQAIPWDKPSPIKGIACTIKAGGVGITLTRACHMLQVDEEWTPAWNEQMQDRILRIGQQRPVLIRKLVANHPLDERKAEVNTAKQMLIAASVDAARDKSLEGATERTGT